MWLSRNHFNIYLFGCLLHVIVTRYHIKWCNLSITKLYVIGYWRKQDAFLLVDIIIECAKFGKSDASLMHVIITKLYTSDAISISRNWKKSRNVNSKVRKRINCCIIYVFLILPNVHQSEWTLEKTNTKQSVFYELIYFS